MQMLAQRQMIEVLQGIQAVEGLERSFEDQLTASSRRSESTVLSSSILSLHRLHRLQSSPEYADP